MSRTAVLFALFLVASGGYFWQKYRSSPYAPDFEMRTPDGRRVVRDDYYGQVVVLDFWASWCPPCRMSIPAMDRLYDRFRDRGVRVYGVQVRDDVDPEAFLARHGANYPSLVGNADVERDYRVNAVPTIVVIGADGRVIHRSQGWSSGTEERLERVLNDHLAQVGID
ncbi:MAG: TlpA disulfide reductase family protein [Phycisphaerales bacterium]